MSKLLALLILLILSATDVESRSRRRRRGIWPDVLAPGGNTFAASGYYNMHSYIAYPESGIAFNPVNQPWNTYWPNYYPANQFNSYNQYSPNLGYPFNNNQVATYGDAVPTYGYPYTGQDNNNLYYPGRAGNVWFPPDNNMARPMTARSNANFQRLNSIDSSNNPPNK